MLHTSCTSCYMNMEEYINNFMKHKFTTATNLFGGNRLLPYNNGYDTQLLGNDLGSGWRLAYNVQGRRPYSWNLLSC